MKDNDSVQLLIKETGCDVHEAELALSLCENNLEKAIETIGFLLRFITAFKIKIIFPKENIYGIIHIAVNMKTLEILRFTQVFSHNPAVYEISCDMDWFSFEKAIFSARLDSGAMENYTQSLEENFRLYTQQAIKQIQQISNDEISTIIQTFFHPIQVEVKVVSEELNLTQYKKLPDFKENQNESNFTGYDLGFVRLDVEILQDSNGKPASQICEGDTVLSLITDQRDIAHYLAHLIGGRRNGNMIPLPAIVKKIIVKDNEIECHLHYAPSITGVAKIKKELKLKIMEVKNESWWKKIMPW